MNCTYEYESTFVSSVHDWYRNFASPQNVPLNGMHGEYEDTIHVLKNCGMRMTRTHHFFRCATSLAREGMANEQKFQLNFQFPIRIILNLTVWPH